ncbi:hypothetical protein [Allopusillimonas ginsengisoli]|uniref:hypothetical protein n=1 Tax=Allopusillimonas ginsengisoli TaxID=453575 RepID=UPI00102015E3|nr:hypothetical protein [Allopusillimonas ginsengisoli]TEA78909.1 hypothetical protein ERE07_05795 [Allopusillimonas ginsengisoli]
MANVMCGKLATAGNIQISHSTGTPKINRAAFAQRAWQLLNRFDRSMAGYLGALAEARVRAPFDHDKR